MENRNNKKNKDLTGSGMVISICPIITPTINVAVTGPKEKDLYLRFPSQKPKPKVRKIGITGLLLKYSINQLISPL